MVGAQRPDADQIDPAGRITVLKRTFPAPGVVAVDAAGNLYCDAGLYGFKYRVVRMDLAGFDDDFAIDPDFRPPRLAVDAKGNLYVSDEVRNRVVRVDTATGTITTVAGRNRFG